MQAKKDIVLAAIEALTPEEKKRLRRYADWRMLAIHGTVHHSDGGDLYNEAITRTLDGRRKWHLDERTMFEHLHRCISSIAADWYKEMKRYGTLSDVHASPDTLHAEVTRGIDLQRIARGLKDDAMATAVFESLLNREKPQKTIARLKIRPEIYDAARRRVLRLGRKLLLPRRRPG